MRVNSQGPDGKALWPPCLPLHTPGRGMRNAELKTEVAFTRIVVKPQNIDQILGEHLESKICWRHLPTVQEPDPWKGEERIDDNTVKYATAAVEASIRGPRTESG